MLYLHQYYQPGAQISLNLRSCDGDATARNVQATVVKAFTPFTMSQVLMLDINPPHPDILPPNTSFILKVYDPRFLQHRQGTKSSGPHPWTLAAETVAARRRAFGADTATSLPTWWPDDSDSAGWEEFYRASLELLFKNELAAYTRLRSLQGRSIPHCYAHGTLVLPSPSKRMLVPRVLLLSYVPGPCLRAVNPSRVAAPIAHGLIDTVRAFGMLGVIHDDLRPDNIIVSPVEDHSSVFVLDFGNAQVRTDQTDEEWEWTLAENDEPKVVEMILDKLGIKHSL
ncbi:hypothetical protein K438DRAFT_1807657 [Mycena galopus ATCC 62051]|nr:hypothetical protein K438DRAFT_1807657 [Mycena galopus ATCC 62051]